MSNAARLSSPPQLAQIKYRAACDHCSSTKTKCTQERPSCQRCLALGRHCNYSRSLRAGKPPRSSRKLKQAVTSIVLPRPSSRPTTDFLIESPQEAWNRATTPYPTPSLTPSTAPGYFASGNMTSRESNSSSQSLSPANPDWISDCSQGNDMSTDCKPQSPHPGILESHHWTHFASRTSDMGGEFEELARYHANPVKCISDTDECVKLATATLAALYNLPMTTASGVCSSDRRPTAEEALDATTFALQNLQTVMAYVCAKDFTLPMVILSIASKLLAWHQAVACVQDPFTQGMDNAKELVVDTSSTMNGRERFGWVLKHQVVQGQLHGLSDVLSSFRNSYCTEGMAEAGLTFACMEGHLRTRLMVTMQEIDARLRSC